MLRELRTSVGLFLFLAFIGGLAYPFLVMMIGQNIFAHQANGSLIRDKNKIIGSILIGQSFSGDKYFHPRPSTAGNGYDAARSGASNLAPSSKELKRNAKERVEAARKAGDLMPFPIDMITASGSGLDPHISPAAAQAQVARIADLRGLSLTAVKELIRQYTVPPTFGILGTNRINVLELNRALDQMKPPKR